VNGNAINSSGFPRSDAYAGDIDEVDVLALPVSFSDKPYSPEDHASLVQAMEEVLEYFSEMSGARAGVSVVTAPLSLVANLSRTAESFGVYSESGDANYDDIVLTAIRAADPSLEVSSFDVVVIETPHDERANFWPVSLEPPTELLGSGIGGIVVSGGVYAGSWRPIAHELGHAWLGLEDLYDRTPPPEYDGTFWEWDLMNSFRGRAPELTAWHRFLLSWLSDDQVRCLAHATLDDSYHFLSPLQSNSTSPKAILRPLDLGRILVVESRRATRYDSEGRNSVLVYIVDTNLVSGDGPFIAQGELSLEPLSRIEDRFPIPVGKSIDVEGVRIELVGSDASGDLIRVGEE
jgi:M6 family metalloprotease-like protein